MTSFYFLNSFYYAKSNDTPIEIVVDLTRVNVRKDEFAQNLLKICKIFIIKKCVKNPFKNLFNFFRFNLFSHSRIWFSLFLRI